MNRQILKQYIDLYKRNFSSVSQQEIYKWRAVKCFQDNWNIDATDFHSMLENSLRLVGNLMDSGNYFPKKMLLNNAKIDRAKIRDLFINLYKEDEDLYHRIDEFQSQIEVINEINYPERHNYQDHRAIIVYLSLRFPERYFFYKFEMFKQFSEKLEIIYKPIRGRNENIGHFNSQCEFIRHELSLDQELLKLHKNRLTEDCYFDENLNILTQDFIYAVVRHLNQSIIITASTVEEITEQIVLSSKLSTTSDNLNFKGHTVNFIQNGIDNKRIGDLGELWVLKYEIDKLTKANKLNLLDKIKHTSKDEGDGTGFDIQSFDKNGVKIFIEVKTTKGKKNSTFFVSRHELEKSKIEKGNYYIYRLYNYNEEADTADLLIIRGELTKLCVFPSTYKINLTNE